MEEDKPYVPPMGDPASRLFGGGSSKPRVGLPIRMHANDGSHDDGKVMETDDLMKCEEWEKRKEHVFYS